MSSGGSGGGSPRATSPTFTEEIQFNEANGKDGFALRPTATKIRVIPSGDSQMNDSSPLHFTTVVDYSWESHYTYGRLIATHLHSMFIAYVVKVANVGAVRVIDMDSKERVLMKGDKGLIKDVDFLHKPEEIILGFIDEYGTFYINKIIKELKTGKLTAHPVIKVTLDGSPVRLENRRFIWCKYVPDELQEVATPRDCAFHFAVLQNDVIYAANLVQLVQRHQEGSHNFHEIREQLLTIDTHSSAVTDASFAPDGTALATCSKDGTVKFFQMYFPERAPARCLYSWAPHDGRPIDKIFFLDNHTINETPADSKYWKFMVTAAENMSELKLFTCRSWECLQTINFCTPTLSQWKVEIDLTAKYLVATDIHRKAMYMIHLEYNDQDYGRFHWIREFSMPWNVIGFNISAASALTADEIMERGLTPSLIGNESLYARDEYLNLLEMNLVQPRSLQQGSVAIKTPEFYSRSNGHHRISFNKDVSYKDTKLLEEPTLEDNDNDEASKIRAELELPTTKSNVALSSPRAARATSLENEKSAVVASPSTTASNLNTSSRRSTSPNSLPKEVPSVAEMSEQLSSLIGLFPASGGRVSARSSTSSTRGRSNSPHQVTTVVPPITLDHVPQISAQTNGSTSKTSASSSPSREVEEILSPKSTENFVARASVAGMEEILVMNADINLDPFENGNLPPVLQMKPERKSPLKTKTYSGTEMYPQIPQVLDKVNSLVDLMTIQANEIKELKREVGRLTVLHVESTKGGEETAIISQIMDKHFKQTQSQFNRLEDVLRSMDTSERQRAAQQPTNSIPPNLAEVLAVSIGSIVKSEIESVLPAALASTFEPARLGVSAQIDRLTSVVEAKLTQNISQIMQREKIWQTLTANFQTITKSVFDTTFNDIFMNSVFPRCQNAVHEMLTQVNETFMKGTKEYLTGLEGVLERERKREDFQEMVRHQINTMQDALSSALQVEIEAQMLRVLGGIQGGVVRQIEESMSRELSRAFKDQQRFFEISVIPRAVTPAVSVCESIGGMGGAVSVDPAVAQKRVLDTAKSGDIHGAFVQASNLGNVDVLMYLCRSYSPQTVFYLKLPTHVHVSIMQLLALDIMEDTETKINYLNVGLASLDMRDSKTLKSVGRMIPVFQAAVSKYQDRNPESKLLSSIKLLEMAFHGIGAQLKTPGTPSQSASQHSYSSQYQ